MAVALGALFAVGALDNVWAAHWSRGGKHVGSTSVPGLDV